jgi:hypothetical protein
MEQSMNSNFFDEISEDIWKLNKIDSNPLIDWLNLQLNKLKEWVTKQDENEPLKIILDEFLHSLKELHKQEEKQAPESNNPLKKELYSLKMSIILNMQRQVSDYFVVVWDDIYINTKNSVVRGIWNRIQEQSNQNTFFSKLVTFLNS